MYLIVRLHDAEGLGDFLHRGIAPHVQEIGRLAAVKLDDVHRGHGQAGAIHHAGHIAPQIDVGESRFRRGAFLRVFLALVPQRFDIRMAIERAVVEIELRVKG